LFGGGSVGYCDQTTCNIAFSGLKLPNGLVVGHDGLIYVPSSVDGSVKIFNLSENHILVEVNKIKVPMPIDNLSVDKRGDIYVAAFPKLYAWAESSKNPFDVHPPSAVFRIRKSSKGHDAEYVVEKVLEDDGSVLPGTTTAVHDAETGKVYLGGVMSAYITICEPALPDEPFVVR
jgi:hypothetical protein